MTQTPDEKKKENQAEPVKALSDSELETVSGGSGATAPSFRLEAGDGGFYICGPAGEKYEYVKDEPPYGGRYVTTTSARHFLNVGLGRWRVNARYHYDYFFVTVKRIEHSGLAWA